ncbi:hypothetical protein B23_0247 [Geobacillus thermoleovorans B23]|nr:hypothetical protein B23_0247 [Geobacillus thermoleovorans B23]
MRHLIQIAVAANAAQRLSFINHRLCNDEAVSLFYGNLFQLRNF